MKNEVKALIVLVGLLSAVSASANPPGPNCCEMIKRGKIYQALANGLSSPNSIASALYSRGTGLTSAQASSAVNIVNTKKNAIEDKDPVKQEQKCSNVNVELASSYAWSKVQSTIYAGYASANCQ